MIFGNEPGHIGIWFAWRPVRLFECGRTVWLQRIKRKRINGTFTNIWLYYLKEDNRCISY